MIAFLHKGCYFDLNQLDHWKFVFYIPNLVKIRIRYPIRRLHFRGFQMIGEIKLSSLVALLIFVGMFTGGSLIRFVFLLLNKNTLYLPIFCGGLLTGLFVLDLLPDAFHHFSRIGVLTGIALGILIMISVEFYLHNYFKLRHKHQESYYLLILALIIHSLPTGISFGMNLYSHHILNYGLFAAFILHHVPEGMIIMTSIPTIRERNRLFTSFCLLLSIFIGLTIYIGLNVKLNSLKWETVMMGMTLGTLGYVTFYEMLWKKSKTLPKGKVALVVILGIIGIHFFL
jgi:zinc transporter, ZIP family